MKNKNFIWIGIALIIVIVIGAVYFFSTQNSSEVADQINNIQEDAQAGVASFFITSSNPGLGADFGGIEGADLHCQGLAEEAGYGDGTWRAYLSTTATDAEEAINARDRIGSGPWYNVDGELIAANLEDLHSDNLISKELALSEIGEMINGRGDTPNVHDILTGSLPDGTASLTEDDTTCANWSSSDEGSATVGHHDRQGLDDTDSSKSWNSSHASRGCSLENLNGTGGGGLLYCFLVSE